MNRETYFNNGNLPPGAEREPQREEAVIVFNYELPQTRLNTQRAKGLKALYGTLKKGGYLYEQ